MAAVMWVEVLSRDGTVAARERIASEEARIGRAFDNDVVIDDPHVAPHHLRIFRGEDGELVAEDLGTVNGLYREHGAERLARLALAGEPGIRIGRTVLRVHDAAHAVAPEKPLTPPRAHASWAAGLTIGLFALILAVNWLDLTSEPSMNVILLPLLGLATAIAIWSGLWALLSRVFFGQAQYAVQLRIAATACIALVIWDQLVRTLSFAFAWREMAEYAGLGAWALLGVTCVAHLHTLGPRHMRAAKGVVVVLIAAGAAIQYFGRSETRMLFGQRATLGDLRPPALRLAPRASVEQFFERAEDIRRKVDVARTKEPAPGGLLSDLDTSD
jgi:FHA domain-containing protein